jgi:DNA polymerase III delta prime subunit
MKSHYLWVEKYRPDSLAGYLGNTQMKEKFTGFIESGDIPHLLLVGPAGTGKTTAARILMNSIDCDRKSINASDENNIETVRTVIRGFACTRGFAPLKIMLLDEFDGFTRQGQDALRNLMETHSDTTRFILTANHLERVIEPIISRSQFFKVVPSSKKDACIHLAGILKQEGVSFKPADIKLIVDAYFPDLRKIINEAQLATSNKTLQVSQQALVDSDVKLTLLAAITRKADVLTMRQMIADAGLRDFTDVFRLLYDRVLEYAQPAQVPGVILALNEGQYRDALVVDKEINMISTLIQILEIVK